jgi:hypothetical protein
MSPAEREDFFSHLCWSLAVGRRPVALVTFYADDSGTRDKSNVAVGGYVADKLRWDKFGKRWQRILDREKICVLHRTDMEWPFHKEFKGWSKPRQKKVLREAHNIIKQNTLLGLGNSISTASYGQLVPPPLKKAFGGPYGWAAHACHCRNCEMGTRTQPLGYIYF